MVDRNLLPHAWLNQRPERYPKYRLHLGAQRHRGAILQREYKWTDDDGWENRRPGMEVVQDPEQLGGREVDADFLAHFADGGDAEVMILRIAPPAGEGDLTRPGVAGANGAMDEERFDAVVAVMQHDRDRGGNHSRRDRKRDGAVVAQRAANLVYAEISSPPSTLITLPVIQSAPGWQSDTIAPPRSAGVVRR